MLVSLQLDGEISEFESRALTRHLDGCPICAELARRMLATTELLRAQPLPALRRPLETPSVGASRRSRRLIPSPRFVAAAAVAVLGVGVVSTVVGGSGDDPASRPIESPLSERRTWARSVGPGLGDLPLAGVPVRGDVA